MAECCGDADGRTVLFYACSGGANVGEVADRACRQLMDEGAGTMFCLAGLGGGIEGMIQTAKDADLNVVIDGCPMDCAKKTFDRAGVTDYVQFRVTDLDIEKVKGVRATDEEVTRTVDRARATLAEVRGRTASRPGAKAAMVGGTRLEDSDPGHGVTEVQDTHGERQGRGGRTRRGLRTREGDRPEPDHAVRRDDDAGAGRGRLGQSGRQGAGRRGDQGPPDVRPADRRDR